MSLDEFEKWLERKHPENLVLMDEFTQDMNAKYDEQQKLWDIHLEKYGREKTCPVCKSIIYYVIPSLWDMSKEDSTISVPCFNGCGILEIKNIQGNIEEEFIPRISASCRVDDK